MSRETWKEMGKPSEIMGLRYPVTHKLNMKKNKVLISEDYGIKGLKKGNTVLSQHDTYVNHFGDYDGDIVQLFPIGGKKGFPNLVMDSIEAERKKMGEILVDASIEKKFEKLPPTEKNLLEISSNAVMGEQVVGSTSALVRIMPTLVDNKMRIEFSSSKNWEPRKYSVYYGDYKHSSGIIKQDGKAHKQRTLKPVWNRENEKLAIQLNNAGTDAISSPALIGMGWEPNFLLKKFFGTSDDNAVGAVRNMLFPKKGVSPQTPYKITLSKGKEPLDSILKDIKDYNELSQNIVKGGGKLTPTQNVVAELKGVTSYGELDNKSRLLADTFASTAVKNAVEIPAITPNSQKFINFAENLIEKSSRNFSDKAMKKTNRKKIVDYYNKGLTQFNKEDIDRISYWAITNPKANWAKIAGTKTPSKFVWRFDEFFEPKQAKIFFNAYEESAAKSIKSLNKNTEPK